MKRIVIRPRSGGAARGWLSARVTLDNRLGGEVLSRQVDDSARLSLRHLPRGMYVVKVAAPQGECFVTKLIVK